MKKSTKFIILGASSFLGRLFYQKYKKDIVFASRNKNKIYNLPKFDLLKDNILKIIKTHKASHIIIFAGETNLNNCFLKKKISNKLNYLIPKNIIKKCLKYKITPIVFSTDYVLGGYNKNSDEESFLEPQLEYGFQKSRLEKFIKKNNLPVLTLRLSRIFSDIDNVKNFLLDIKKQAIKNNKIFLANDQFFSPVYANDVVDLIYILAKNGFTGLFNIGGPKRLSRFIIGEKIIKHLKLKTLLMPASINEFCLYEKRPLEISLNSNKIKTNVNYNFKRIDTIIKNMI
jgi:dTDP-4-dehydrorhamnose reductase